jgi:hypothetical protein
LSINLRNEGGNKSLFPARAVFLGFQLREWLSFEEFRDDLIVQNVLLQLSSAVLVPMNQMHDPIPRDGRKAYS